jgi:hypothetical protein
MTISKKVLGLTLAAFVGVASSFADDAAKGTGRKSLESRIAELEAKLKDAGAGGVQGSGIKVSGYVDTSYIVNFADRDAAAPIAGSSAQNTGRVFDNQYNAFNLNAVKLTIEKSKDSSKFPAGFRVDLMYGQDAGIINGGNNVTAFSAAPSSNDNDLAVEQAYVNFGVPLGNGVDVKVGKMVTLIGYEVIESPANWQFSRSDAFRLSPLTQLGVTLGYQWTDFLTSTVGLINGVDSGIGGPGATVGAGNRNTNLAFIGRLDATAPKNSWGEFNGFLAGLVANDGVTPATVVGTAPANLATSNDQGLYIWNVGGGWNKPFGIKPLGLGLDFLYRNDSIAATGAGAIAGASSTIDASALTGYGKWDWNKWLTTSARISYSWYDNATQRNAAGVIINQQSLGAATVPTTLPDESELYTFTLTQAFNIWKDTLARLEWRHDWTPNGTQGFGTAAGDVRQEQDTIAVNLVYSF